MFFVIINAIRHCLFEESKQYSSKIPTDWDYCPTIWEYYPTIWDFCPKRWDFIKKKSFNYQKRASVHSSPFSFSCCLRSSSISWKSFFLRIKLEPKYFSLTIGLAANSSGTPWKRILPSKSK